MQKVSLDFETYREADIKKWGAWGYACHPSTEVICMAYAIGESAPVLWLPGEALPEFIREPGGFTLHAWNSFFAWGIWHHVQGWPETEMTQWHDTAALAAALALPRALGECGAALGISQTNKKTGAANMSFKDSANRTAANVFKTQNYYRNSTTTAYRTS